MTELRAGGATDTGLVRAHNEDNYLADELTIGRAAGCQIPLDDSYASQLHARLFRRNSELLVEDLGSTNGTFLNRKKVDSAVPIRKGDRLQVGKTVLELTK